MKRLTKSLWLLCITLMCMLSAPSIVQAAVKTPGKVTGVKATAYESKAVLKWKKASNATGYIVYQVNDDKTLTKIGTTKSTSYKITKLTNNTTYTYCITAYRTSKSQKYEGKKSAYVKVTPQVKKPGKVNLSIKSCSDGKISMKWKKVSNATGYQVYQYDASKDKFLSIGTVKGASVTVKKLTNGKSYKFKVRAYRTVGGVTRYGTFSTTLTAKPLLIKDDVKSMPTMGFKATVKKTVKASLKDGSGTVTVKKGTKVKVTYRTYNKCTVVLNNNKTVYIHHDNLRFTGCIYSSSKDLTKSAKEQFVNYKGYHSKTKYLIWVSLYKQRLYIFKGSQCNWKLEKSFKCSTGKASTSTPKGTYTLWKKSYFFPFDEYSYANYASYFSGNAIHSWVKLYGSGAWYNDGKLGHPASHGCVRLGDSQVVYVYNKVPLGTTIIIY